MERGPAPLTQRGFLRDVAYKDGDRLRARMSIYRYREDPSVLAEQVLARCEWPAGARVLDVGCGPGAYLRLLAGRGVRAVGLDLSEGMCREARAHAPTAVGDAAALPLPDGAVDRVLAPHMLYHCPDVPGTVRELRRVLAPDGVALVVLNRSDHLHQLRALTTAVLGIDALARTERVDLDDGLTWLGAAFHQVEVVPLPSRLRVPTPEPVLAYVDSLSGWAPADEAARTELRARVEAEIAARGAFVVDACPGVLVCR